MITGLCLLISGGSFLYPIFNVFASVNYQSWSQAGGGDAFTETFPMAPSGTNENQVFSAEVNLRGYGYVGTVDQTSKIKITICLSPNGIFGTGLCDTLYDGPIPKSNTENPEWNDLYDSIAALV